MKHILPLLVMMTCVTLPTPDSRASDPKAANEQNLRVMIQGSSGAAMRELVQSSGGTITHDLHIINAVGALLSQAQLDEVLTSPLVIRHIDDLSIGPVPPTDPDLADKSCDVGGALELSFSKAGINWTLYNKFDAPAVLQQLALSWPEQLGTIASMSLDGAPVDPGMLTDTGAGSLNVEFGGLARPTLEGKGDLELRFRPAPGAPDSISLRQRDFSAKADFAGDCTVKLIPGYDANHEDFYYAGVSGADALHLHGVTGKGVTVAVLDSGLWDHDLLTRDTAGENRVLARYDAIDNSVVEQLFDASGHGTHMTSVLAHSGATTRAGIPTGSYKGIAPDVNLVSVKAFNVEGQGGFLDIVRGIQWVVDHRETYNIRVLNLSFGARPRWPYWLDPIDQAVMRAWASGITVVAAAGNDGPEPMTIGSPGNVPYIITVGAITDSWTPQDRDDDYIPDFSSRGPTPEAHIKPDLVAPGGHITGLTRPGATLTEEHPEYLLSTGEFVMTGSSQATALVSGIVALLLQLEPDLSPDDVKCKLISSAEPAINADGLLAYSPFEQGQGLVTATRAVTLGNKGCGNAGLNITRDIAGTEHFQGPATIDDGGGVSLPGLNNMVSAQPSEQGLSTRRKWGVKAHIERLTHSLDPNQPSAGSPFNWEQAYIEEKAAIEALSRP